MPDEEVYFDFGFTTATEEEIFEPIAIENQTAITDATQEAQKLQDKLTKLYNAIQPLLTNLKANPEKDYIHWPNRVEKVDQFAGILAQIYNS